MHSPQSRREKSPKEALTKILGGYLMEAQRRPQETEKMLDHLDWLLDFSLLPEALERRFSDSRLLQRLLETTGQSQEVLMSSEPEAYLATISLALEVFVGNPVPN